MTKKDIHHPKAMYTVKIVLPLLFYSSFIATTIFVIVKSKKINHFIPIINYTIMTLLCKINFNEKKLVLTI